MAAGSSSSSDEYSMTATRIIIQDYQVIKEDAMPLKPVFFETTYDFLLYDPDEAGLELFDTRVISGRNVFYYSFKKE